MKTLNEQYLPVEMKYIYFNLIACSQFTKNKFSQTNNNDDNDYIIKCNYI